MYLCLCFYLCVVYLCVVYLCLCITGWKHCLSSPLSMVAHPECFSDMRQLAQQRQSLLLYYWLFQLGSKNVTKLWTSWLFVINSLRTDTRKKNVYTLPYPLDQGNYCDLQTESDWSLIGKIRFVML